MDQPTVACPKCGHRFSPTRFWGIVARSPQHPIWVLGYIGAAVAVISFMCNSFDTDEIMKLATLGASICGIYGIRKGVEKVTG